MGFWWNWATDLAAFPLFHLFFHLPSALYARLCLITGQYNCNNLFWLQKTWETVKKVSLRLFIHEKQTSFLCFFRL